MSVKSAKGLSAQTGIKGKLGSFMNHGTRQVTLGGKPLYYFAPDIRAHNKKQATGDELKTFGSIWHIVTVGKSKSTNSRRPTHEPTKEDFHRATSRRPRPRRTSPS